MFKNRKNEIFMKVWKRWWVCALEKWYRKLLSCWDNVQYNILMHSIHYFCVFSLNNNKDKCSPLLNMAWFYLHWNIELLWCHSLTIAAEWILLITWSLPWISNWIRYSVSLRELALLSLSKLIFDFSSILNLWRYSIITTKS